MELEIALLFTLICGFSALIHGSIGFGFPMIATPLLALFTDVQTAIMLTIIPNILINIVTIMSEGSFSEAFNKHYVLIILTAFGSFVGTSILIYFQTDIFKAILAIVIAIYVITDVLKLRIRWIGNHPKISKVTFGLISGIMGGLTNVMGPTLIIYSLESDQPKQEIVQSTNLCFLFGKITQLTVFAFTTNLSLHTISNSALIFSAVMVFLPIGIKLKTLISESLYKMILKVLLTGISITLITQTHP